MFKAKAAGSFASKIAHTSTIPALGNKDLKLLQDLITNEKTVLSTLQKLAVDFAKASESLKSWGLGEGEDLGDVLSHATNIYAHISAALNNFANHEHTVRAHLKAIRGREEKLDDIKRKRKSVAVKADAADKKLSKMSGENKNLPAQTDILNKLRDEIRQLDTDIMVEEARLGDFKRMSTRNFMALKLGGLLEFGEKATIVGELGKLLIEEIPLDPTPPGQPRAFYASHPKTENLDAEVSRCVGEVVFTAPPDISEGNATYAPPPLDSGSQGRGSDDIQSPPDGGSAYGAPPDARLGYAPPPQHDARAKTLSEFGNTTPQDGMGEFGESGPGHRRFGSGPIPMRIGDDGQRVRADDGPRIGIGGGGGQFSTFPVKARTGPGSAAPGAAGGPEPSFSASVADALGESEYNANAGAPSVNVGGNPWDGDEYGGGGGHARNGSQDSSQLPYASPDQGPGHQRGESRDALGVEKGVRFRTPSMEVSGMVPVAPGMGSPVYPSAGGWAGRAGSYDAPVSPVRAEPDVPPYSHEPYPADDEYARNSAAAREVAREMDALQFAPPGPPPSLQQYQPPSANLQPTRPLSINRSPSPLAPPNAPFAQPRSVSPNPPVGGIGSPRPDSPGSSYPSRPGAGWSPTADATPYNTPPEYPAAASTTSLAAAAASPSGGPRMISAAAFKRAGRSGSDAELGKKRPLPSSPYPARTASSGLARSGSQDNAARGTQLPSQLPSGAQPPDYFPAQTSREPESPVISDYGSLGNMRVANGEGAGAGSPGYSQSKFVTNLED